jgi:CubicO group peptidase (beta-lactamase class C family)
MVHTEQQSVAAIDALIAERVGASIAATGTPGVAVAVVRDDAVIHARGYGTTSVEEGGVPVTERTLFQIGSVTKPLTGTLIMRLVDRGVLALDVPIRTWLPELTFAESGAADVVTLRMLLSHTAGLPWDQISPTRVYGRRDPEGLAAWVRDELPTRPFEHAPGGRWQYSNPGINLAAHVAEVAAGQHYADLMRTEVFEPLGMERTTFDPTIAMTYPMALSHRRDDDERIVVEHRMADNTAQAPAAIAYSSASDLSRFIRFQLNGGDIDGARILSAASVAEMQRPHVERGEGDGGSYGLTLSINDWHGLRRTGHIGGILNYGCELAFLPGHSAGVVILYNHDPFDTHAIDLADAVLEVLTGDEGGL